MENDLFDVLNKLHQHFTNDSKDELYPELKKNLYSGAKYNKEYYEENKELIKKTKKEWYQRKNNKYILCECGAIVKIFGLKAHKKSSKHKIYEIMNIKKPKNKNAIECDCGSTVIKMKQHLQTKKHKLWASGRNKLKLD